MSLRPVAVVGPSGAGKDLLMTLACARLPEGVRAVRRVITRPSEAGGEDFEGVSEAEFDRRLAAGAFLLHWDAHGLRYAIPESGMVGEGVLLFNASRGVLEEALARMPDLRIILVTAPPEVLAARLSGRGRESAGDQAARLARADFALPPGLPVTEVMNDAGPEEGLARFLAALQAGSPVSG